MISLYYYKTTINSCNKTSLIQSVLGGGGGVIKEFKVPDDDPRLKYRIYIS